MRSLAAIAGCCATLAAAPSGSLVQPPTPFGCAAPFAMTGCALTRGFSTDSIAARGETFGADGRTIYQIEHEDLHAAAVLRIDEAGRRLAQLPGASGCLVEIARAGCGLAGKVPDSLSFSPDGRFAYADVAGALETFASDPASGALRELGETPTCEFDCTGGVLAAAPRFAPDGRFAYGAGLQALAYDAATGAFTPTSTSPECLMEPQDPNDRSRPCTAVQLPAGGAVTFALDNETVYVTGESGLAILRRDPVTGAVSPAPGPKPCFALRARRCMHGVGLGHVFSLALTPDGRTLIGLGFAISVFNRVP